MDQDETNELVGRLFYLMTVKLEDAATAAADGQGRDIAAAERIALAERVRAAGQEVMIVAEAAVALLGSDCASDGDG